MSPKLRSIILLVTIFVIGAVTGFFAHGVYDHQRMESYRQRRHEPSGKSRFVGFFIRVINPSADQLDSVTPILEKWDLEMKTLQTRFARESQERFKSMLSELAPLLDEKQMQSLKDALERFGPHRRYPRSGKKGPEPPAV